jgi:hypothetical protein
MFMPKYQKVGAVFLSILMLILFGIAVNHAMNRLNHKSLAAGERLPYLDLSNIRAPAFEGKGHRTLYVFVRKGCIHCEALLSTLSQLAADRSAHLPVVDVVVVGPKEDARQLASHIETFSIFSDPGEKNFEACYGTRVPLQILVDQSGTVLATHMGEIDLDPEQQFLDRI